MYLNLNIQPHQLQQISDFLAPLDNLRTNFKILTAGKDTYIVNGYYNTRCKVSSRGSKIFIQAHRKRRSNTL